MTKEKCIVLFSGGLDSRLVVKIMQDRGYNVETVHFNLPFGCGCCDFGCNFKFTQMSGVNFKIFDASKGKLLKQYLELLKKAEHGRGSAYNPCRDCKIWMFTKAKKYADTQKIKVIATGEVLGQRPMSQTKNAMEVIDKEIGFELTRPLIEIGIKGRRRDKQMALAKKYKIKYPTPAGGCLLCEKELKRRFEFLIENNLINDKTLPLVNIGRHFIKDKCWFVVARNEKECRIIETFNTLKGTSGKFIEGVKGKPSVYYNKLKGHCSVYPKLRSKGAKKFAEELQEDFKKGGEKKYLRDKL